MKLKKVTIKELWNAMHKKFILNYKRNLKRTVSKIEWKTTNIDKEQ